MYGVRLDMRRKKFKQKQKKSMTHLLVTAFMVLFIGAVTVTCAGQFRLYQSLKSDEAKLTKSLEAEKKRKTELSTKKDFYSSDAYIEKIAREQLGLIKPNEVLYINRAK